MSKIETHFLAFGQDVPDTIKYKRFDRGTQIHISFIDKGDGYENEYTARLVSSNKVDYTGNFISHSISTKEEASRGSITAKRIVVDEETVILYGRWIENGEVYRWFTEQFRTFDNDEEE
jgi:hypothetical protein